MAKERKAGYFRQARRNHEFHLSFGDASAQITIESGRPEVRINAPKSVKISHRKPKPRLTRDRKPA